MDRTLKVIVLVLMLMMPRVSSAYNYYYQLYYDTETSAVLVETFGHQLTSEMLAASYLEDYRDYYLKANVSMAGITLLKRMERKALHDAGVLGIAGSENYYYQHIYKLVYTRIIPQILRCAVLLVDHIDQVYVWAPHLDVICKEVRSLCGQFSAVCGNGALTFNFGFPQVADEVLDILGLNGLQGVNWRELFGSFSDIQVDLDLDSIAGGFKKDFKDIYNAGSTLLSGGYSSLDTVWANRSSVGKIFSGKPQEIKDRIDSLKDVYDDLVDSLSIKDRLKDFIGVVDSAGIVQKFFTYRDCKPEDFIRDFTKSKNDSFYRQRWYIVRNGTDVVYEETFDSSKMNEDIFEERMKARLEEYQNKANDYTNGENPFFVPDTYKIQKDAKVTFTQPAELRLKGVSQAVFYVHCEDGGSFGNGSYTFKVDPKHDPLDEKSKEYAMETELTDFDDSDKETLYGYVKPWQEEYNRLDGIISGLDYEIDDLYYQSGEGTLTVGGKPILDVIESKENERDEYKRELKNVSDSLSFYKGLYDDYVADAEPEDDIFRIPHIMRMYESDFGLQWLEEGHWEGYTWVRKAYFPAGKENVTLRVELECARKEKYFLIHWMLLRIHRSRITMNFALYYSSPSDNAVEYLDLDPEAAEEDNEAVVSEHLQKWQEDYPDCQVTVETVVREGMRDSIDDHRVHLLWPSDRVRIARHVNARLQLIHGQLQVMERSLLFTKSLYERLKHPVSEFLRNPATRPWELLYARRERLVNNEAAPGRRREGE